MASLLRKKSSVQVRKGDNNKEGPAPKESVVGLFQQFNSLRHKRKSRVDLSTAVEPERSAALRKEGGQELQKQRSLTQLRRRLVRKASAFNLHTRHHNRRQEGLDQNQRCEYLFPDAYDERAGSHIQPDELKRPASTTVSTAASEAAQTFAKRPGSATSDSAESQITAVPVQRHTLPATHDEAPLPLSPPERVDHVVSDVHQAVLKAQNDIVAKYPGYHEKHHERLGAWAKMATPSAAPPLPYDKLKQITVDACDTALGTTNSYDHSKTEGWNTTIINTILAELVGETSAATSNGPSTSAGGPQSKYKFVVNSTIVQHRSNTVDETTGKGHGRRGMHSAAGAYWNNEKDGMWSFKYEAAERMGLDVVVGIVWIWVG